MLLLLSAFFIATSPNVAGETAPTRPVPHQIVEAVDRVYASMFYSCPFRNMQPAWGEFGVSLRRVEAYYGQSLEKKAEPDAIISLPPTCPGPDMVPNYKARLKALFAASRQLTRILDRHHVPRLAEPAKAP